MDAGTVLLTGATGFIGGRLLHALDEKGFALRCLVRRGETLRPTHPLRRDPEVVYADLLDGADVFIQNLGPGAAERLDGPVYNGLRHLRH